MLELVFNVRISSRKIMLELVFIVRISVRGVFVDNVRISSLMLELEPQGTLIQRGAPSRPAIAK